VVWKKSRFSSLGKYLNRKRLRSYIRSQFVSPRYKLVIYYCYYYYELESCLFLTKTEQIFHRLIQVSIVLYQTFSNNSTECCNKLKFLVETQRNWQTSYWNVFSRDHYSGHPSQRWWAGSELRLRLQQYILTLVTTQLKPIPNLETQILSVMRMVLQHTIWHSYTMLQTMPCYGSRLWYHQHAFFFGFPTYSLVVKLR
jgi:hypothetical protein